MFADILQKYDYFGASRRPIWGRDPVNSGISLAFPAFRNPQVPYASCSLEVSPLRIIPATL